MLHTSLKFIGAFILRRNKWNTNGIVFDAKPVGIAKKIFED